MAVECEKKGIFVKIDDVVMVVEVMLGIFLLLMWALVGFKFGWDWLLNLFLLKSAPLTWEIPLFNILGYRIVPLNLLILVTLLMLLISLIGALTNTIHLGNQFYVDPGVLFYDLSIAAIGFWYVFTSIPPSQDALLGIITLEVSLSILLSLALTKTTEKGGELRWSSLPLYLSIGAVSVFHPFLLAANLSIGLLASDILRGVRFASKHREGYGYVAGFEVVNDALYLVPTLPILLGMFMVFPWS